MHKYISLLYLSYLRYFARKALAKHKPTIIGIAGSVGKSSTAHALFSVLKQHGNTKMVGNSETGIPLGILGLQPKYYTVADWLRMLINAPGGINHLKGTKYLIAEMGIDDPYPPKNMGYLLTILKPDIAIVLNESATHSMQFETTLSAQRLALSEEERLRLIVHKIAEEDCKIITESGCKIAIYNADDENIKNAVAAFDAVISTSFARRDPKEISRQARDDKNPNLPNISNFPELVSFGRDKSNAVSYKSYKITTSSTSLSLSLHLEGAKLNSEIVLSFPGLLLPKEYEQTFAAVIATATSLDVPKETIIKGLQSFSLPKGRSSLLTGINNSKIIDSSYNASKVAVFAFLDMVKMLKKGSKCPAVFLFGDMRELGEEAKIEHRAVAEKLKGIVDYLYLVGPLTREYVLSYLSGTVISNEVRDPNGISPHSARRNDKEKRGEFQEIRWFDNARRAGEYLKDHIPANAIILVKGSQNTIFLEEAIKYILADKDDAKKLCRQSSFWLGVKRKQGILNS